MLLQNSGSKNGELFHELGNQSLFWYIVQYIPKRRSADMLLSSFNAETSYSVEVGLAPPSDVEQTVICGEKFPPCGKCSRGFSPLDLSLVPLSVIDNYKVQP